LLFITTRFLYLLLLVGIMLADTIITENREWHENVVPDCSSMSHPQSRPSGTCESFCGFCRRSSLSHLCACCICIHTMFRSSTTLCRLVVQKATRPTTVLRPLAASFHGQRSLLMPLETVEASPCTHAQHQSYLSLSHTFHNTGPHHGRQHYRRHNC